MNALWNTFLYEPIYNALVFTAQHLAFKDVGLAVVIVTILIRFILMPLSKKSIVSQYKMRLLQPKLDAIKSRGLTKEQESKEQFALYKTEGINPFSGCLYLLIQLPILFALYFAFIKGIDQPTHLYSSLSTEGLKNMFLGLVDITKPFLPFAILAGVTQAIQAFLMPKPPATTGTGFQAQFTKSLSMQTKYVLPIIIIFISAKLASAVALYWVITNIFSIAQELYFRKTLKLTAN
ncbi:MAG: YidC/Oxa1 family membrane protein insertase [Patescibacteria group bacterium]